MLVVYISSVGIVLNYTGDVIRPNKKVKIRKTKVMSTSLSVIDRMAINGASLSWDGRVLYHFNSQLINMP